MGQSECLVHCFPLSLTAAPMPVHASGAKGKVPNSDSLTTGGQRLLLMLHGGVGRDSELRNRSCVCNIPLPFNCSSSSHNTLHDRISCASSSADLPDKGTPTKKRCDSLSTLPSQQALSGCKIQRLTPLLLAPSNALQTQRHCK